MRNLYRYGKQSWTVVLTVLVSALALWPFLPHHLRQLVEPTAQAATFTVTNTDDAGPGSLRQAIIDANTNPGTDTITFNIPGAGVHTISPMSGLPTIADSVIIDGTTQPGFAGAPIIELDGTNAGGADGLRITAGNSTVKGLVINRFGGNGIFLLTNGGNTISGNYIGTDVTGSIARANSFGVFAQDSANNIIGGTTAAARNVVSANGNIGIAISGAAATGNLVQGNYIGTNAAGTAALGNRASGVDVEAANNTIGGTTAGARNVISGSTGDAGITIGGANGSGNLVQGNYIGTDATGMSALGSSGGGVFITGPNNMIGGTAAGARNVISGNLNAGITLAFSQATGNQIQGNFIGVTADGSGALGNIFGALLYSGAGNNSIGGTAANAGNIIANNIGVGVTLFSSAGSGNAILGNSIHDNTFTGNAGEFGLGIDLNADGVTPNDHCDVDTGPNDLQNFPVLTSATSDGTNTTIKGTLDSTPNTQFRIEFFSNSACDPQTGHGGGQTFLGFTNVTTDGSCNASFQFVVPNASVNGSIITATATNPGNSTSEFSACISAAPSAGSLAFSAATYSVNEACVEAIITVNRTNGSTGAVSVDFATAVSTGFTPCNTNTGVASQNCDFSYATGTLSFANGDGSKTFSVLISKDAYVEGPERIDLALSNARGGATLGAQDTATLTITDDATVPTNSQPMDDASTFVCQTYHDFLARQADQPGQDFWTSQITQCGSNQTCINNARIFVSNAFFFELEFQQTGSYVYRLYRAAYGNTQPFPNPNPDTNPPGVMHAVQIPSYAVFVADRARVIGSSNLAQSLQDLATLFAGRAEFANKYPLTLSTGGQFVEAVLATIRNDLGVDLSSQEGALINQFNNAGGGTAGRGAVMFRLAQDDVNNDPINNRAFIDEEYNRSFVVTQYFGYLRRDGDLGGLNFWLGQVNSAPLRDTTKQHAMVCSFITSAEYQNRFSAAVTHTNQECPQ